MRLFFLELIAYARERKTYWLIPFFVALALLAALLALGQHAVVTHFVYPMF